MRGNHTSVDIDVAGKQSLSDSHKVDLNDLMKKVNDERKKSKRQSIVISAAAVSAVAVFGIILTL